MGLTKTDLSIKVNKVEGCLSKGVVSFAICLIRRLAIGQVSKLSLSLSDSGAGAAEERRRLAMGFFSESLSDPVESLSDPVESRGAVNAQRFFLAGTGTVVPLFISLTGDTNEPACKCVSNLTL